MNYLKQWWLQLTTPSVEKVVASFNKAVTKLDKVASFHTQRIAAHNVAISVAQDGITASAAEQSAAVAIRDKLKALITP